MAKKLSNEFVFGWCVTEHHHMCRGALHRPPQDGVAALCLCDCNCHIGQDVKPPEAIVKSLSNREMLAKEMDDWWSMLVVNNAIEIEADEGERLSIQNRFRAESKKYNMTIKTKYKEGFVCVRLT